MGEAGQVPGVGWQSLALSFVSLGAVCIVAWAALRLLAARGVGKAAGAVRVVARCPLEPRRSVYVIEAAGRCFLVGVGDGPMSMLAELDAAALPKSEASAPPPFANPRFANPRFANPRFADVLAKVMGRPRPVSPAPGTDAP